MQSFLSYSNYNSGNFELWIIAALRKITRGLLIAVSSGFIFLSFDSLYIAFDGID